MSPSPPPDGAFAISNRYECTHPETLDHLGSELRLDAGLCGRLRLHSRLLEIAQVDAHEVGFLELPLLLLSIM